MLLPNCVFYFICICWIKYVYTNLPLERRTSLKLHSIKTLNEPLFKELYILCQLRSLHCFYINTTCTPYGVGWPSWYSCFTDDDGHVPHNPAPSSSNVTYRIRFTSIQCLLCKSQALWAKTALLFVCTFFLVLFKCSLRYHLWHIWFLSFIANN